MISIYFKNMFINKIFVLCLTTTGILGVQAPYLAPTPWQQSPMHQVFWSPVQQNGLAFPPLPQPIQPYAIHVQHVQQHPPRFIGYRYLGASYQLPQVRSWFLPFQAPAAPTVSELEVVHQPKPPAPIVSPQPPVGEPAPLEDTKIPNEGPREQVRSTESPLPSTGSLPQAKSSSTSARPTSRTSSKDSVDSAATARIGNPGATALTPDGYQEVPTTSQIKIRPYYNQLKAEKFERFTPENPEHLAPLQTPSETPFGTPLGTQNFQPSPRDYPLDDVRWRGASMPESDPNTPAQSPNSTEQNEQGQFEPNVNRLSERLKGVGHVLIVLGETIIEFAEFVQNSWLLRTTTQSTAAATNTPTAADSPTAAGNSSPSSPSSAL